MDENDFSPKMIAVKSDVFARVSTIEPEVSIPRLPKSWRRLRRGGVQWAKNNFSVAMVGETSEVFTHARDFLPKCFACATIGAYINIHTKAMTEKSTLAEADRDVRAVD